MVTRTLLLGTLVSLHLIIGPPLSPADEPSARLEVSLQKPQDRAVVSLKGERAVIAIESPSGIGRAEFKPAGGKWPKTISLSIGLKDLEGFYAETDALRIQASLGGEKPEVFVRKPNGERQAVPAEERHRIPIKRVGDRIEIELPDVLMEEEGKSIRVQWIDYYR